MEYFQKPNENMINNQVILNQMNSDSITVKTEVRLADLRPLLPLWPYLLLSLCTDNIKYGDSVISIPLWCVLWLFHSGTLSFCGILPCLLY